MEAIICNQHKRIYVKIKVRYRWKSITQEEISALYSEAINDMWDSEIIEVRCDKCKKDKKEKG